MKREIHVLRLWKIDNLMLTISGTFKLDKQANSSPALDTCKQLVILDQLND